MTANLSNRCPKCGGIAQHWLTDLKGDNYYQCPTGLTTLRIGSSRGPITLCDTIIDDRGKIFSGRLGYRTGSGFESVLVVKGKVKEEK